MIDINELTVRGKKDPYNGNKEEIINCYRMINDSNDVIIPSIYHLIKSTYKSVTFDKPNVQLKPNQEIIVKEILDRMEEDKLKATVPIFCNLPTGYGKTMISLFVATQYIKGPTMIVYNSDGVLHSWLKELKNTFNITPHIARGNEIGKHDVVMISKTLASRNVDKHLMEDYHHYKTVICDEADTLCTQKCVDFMLMFKPRVLIGLSATIDKRNGLDKVLDIFWGTRFSWIRRIMNYEGNMKINFVHTGIEVAEMRNMRGTVDWTSISKFISEDDKRMNIIKNLVLSRISSKMMISTHMKKYANDIFTMLRSVGIDTSLYYNNDKNYIDANVVVTTVSKGGRGNDDKNLAEYYDGRRFDTMIMTLTKTDPEQLIGRLRSSISEIFILVDDNSTMKSHMNKISTKYLSRSAVINHIYV
jgi:hypothetical protein